MPVLRHISADLSNDFPLAANTLHIGRSSDNDIVLDNPAVPEIAAEIKRLKQLHDQGALTDEEFATAKAKVLTSTTLQPSVDSSRNSIGRAANNLVKFINIDGDTVIYRG